VDVTGHDGSTVIIVVETNWGADILSLNCDRRGWEFPQRPTRPGLERSSSGRHRKLPGHARRWWSDECRRILARNVANVMLKAQDLTPAHHFPAYIRSSDFSFVSGFLFSSRWPRQNPTFAVRDLASTSASSSLTFFVPAALTTPDRPRKQVGTIEML